MRLNHYLATAGIASRRQADVLIQSGVVKVNGQVVNELGVKVDPVKDKVEVKNQSVQLQVTTVIYLLNKPRGVVTTTTDPESRPTVLELVPKVPRVFPCGRLDAETQGLVLLTNDGNLCYQLTHPKFEHQKEYVVHGHSSNPEKSFVNIKTGLRLKDGSVAIDGLQLLKIHHQKIEFALTIHDGRNRIVRRICTAVGIEIDSLTRIRIGQYKLGDLAPGAYKAV